jgi:hypothetical protein
VLRDATKETYVSDMLCRDNNEVCKHCKDCFTILRTRGGPRRKQSQANLFIVVNLLLDIIWSSSRTPSFPGHPFGPRSFLFYPYFCRVGFLVDAFSLRLSYRSAEPLFPVGGTINGKLLTNNNCYRRHNYYDSIGPGDRTDASTRRTADGRCARRPEPDPQ